MNELISRMLMTTSNRRKHSKLSASAMLCCCLVVLPEDFQNSSRRTKAKKKFILRNCSHKMLQKAWIQSGESNANVVTMDSKTIPNSKMSTYKVNGLRLEGHYFPKFILYFITCSEHSQLWQQSANQNQAYYSLPLFAIFDF